MSEQAREIAEGVVRDLKAAGYVILRRKSHEHTLRELDRARNRVAWYEQDQKRAEGYHATLYAEQRRLSDRLNAVVAAAAALGVPLDAINDALDTAAVVGQDASEGEAS